MPPRSPCEAALGDLLHELHPTLRWYVSAIPDGCIGVGEGVLAEFGAPHRWLWSVSVVLLRQIVFTTSLGTTARARLLYV